MNNKLILTAAAAALIGFSPVMPAMAKGSAADNITPKTILAGALSFLVWPGIGQAVNDDKGEKVATHAVLGLTGVYRFWSCYDAVVDRKGGYWHGRI